MKKLLALLLTLLLLCLSSCGTEKKSCAEILLSAFPEAEGGAFTLYEDHGKEKGIVYPSLFPLLYGTKGHDDVFASICDYAVLLSKNESGFEVHLFRVLHPSQIECVYELLCQRLEMLQNAAIRAYEGEKYERCLSGASIMQIEDMICLLATPDNGGFAAKLKEMS